jgi:hypothetical protein
MPKPKNFADVAALGSPIGAASSGDTVDEVFEPDALICTPVPTERTGLT